MAGINEKQTEKREEKEERQREIVTEGIRNRGDAKRGKIGKGRKTN